MNEPNLRRYTEFFERLSPDCLSQLSTVMTEDVHFVDPFNDVAGLDQVEAIFRHMFENLDHVQFTVTRSAITGESDTAGLIRWELRSMLNGQPYNIVGMSELEFAADGRVNVHIDHWDAGQQFYERIPVVGALLRLIRRRLAV